MKASFVARCSLFVALLIATPGFAQVRDPWEIKTPPLRSFSMPQPKRIELPNGMIVFLQEDHELPLIRGSMRIRGGGRDVSPDKTGLTTILGQSWRTGGTTTKSGDELDEFLESRAARVETGGGVDSLSLSFDVLKEDFDAVFPIVVDLLRNPAFRQDKIDLAKTQAATGISRRNDDPSSILFRESAKLGFGTDSPYARQTEYATIAAITRDDLVAFHKRFVQPANILFGMTGDFDSAAMEARIRKEFGAWPKGTRAAKASDAGSPAKPGTYFVAKDDVTQASIAVVHGGITRDNPDFFALQVMNEILSGGFSGRLMNRLRSQLGLTYGVGGGVGAEWDHPGLFRVTTSTKTESAGETIKVLREELANLRTQPITPEEVAQAKESLLNAYVFTMDSRAKILSQRLALEFYGYPADWYQRYAAEIAKVTVADVERVAKKYVTPDRLALLVVGPAEVGKSLSGATVIDVTIPPRPEK